MKVYMGVQNIQHRAGQTEGRSETRFRRVGAKQRDGNAKACRSWGLGQLGTNPIVEMSEVV